MATSLCTYPPRLAADVEIAEQRDGDRPAFVVGSASTGHYILLHETEHRVLRLLDASIAPAALCETFRQLHGTTLPLATLTRFLSGLDQAGILAGERTPSDTASGLNLGTQYYVRFSLFNPTRFFAYLVPRLRWMWTSAFVACTLLLMLATTLRAVASWDEVTGYAAYVLGDHYAAVLIAGLVVGITHEFAHGLTCTAFGGRATEVGALLIYYVLPALYCNVSGIHFIPKRGHRLWVIAAGVYWELMVGAIALLTWFCLEPYTLGADIAFAFFLGSVVNLIFNANPLIKLDGYYFLSQWLEIPNLMDRSRAYWRVLVVRLFAGERPGNTRHPSLREHAIYATFGLMSFLYTSALGIFIVLYVGEYLADRFSLFGLMLAGGLGLLYLRRPLTDLVASAMWVFKEDQMATNSKTRWARWRPRFVTLALGLTITGVLVTPWSASVGNYGTLTPLPDREAIIRAPEDATLLMLQVQPGALIASGAVLGQMGSLELEEQLVAVQSAVAEARANYDRLVGEVRARGEYVVRGEAEVQQRESEYAEVDAEQRQIQQRRLSEKGSSAGAVLASWISGPLGDAAATGSQGDQPTQYPAAIAVLQSELEVQHAQLVEASFTRDRARKLFSAGLLARIELDEATARAATLESAHGAAGARLEAALVEHRRRHASQASELRRARASLGAERLDVEKVIAERSAIARLIATLDERRSLLERTRAQFTLTSPGAGLVFGEDLPRRIGQHFHQGAEICRVADTRQMLLRVSVPEREIGDIRVGNPVRLKVRAYPNHVFHGAVSKIGGESEQDRNGQAKYRVELTVENQDGSLRPGMTAFARIDFDRQVIARILMHKVKQALRPELWML